MGLNLTNRSRADYAMQLEIITSEERVASIVYGMNDSVIYEQKSANIFDDMYTWYEL
jgi:hypothetical protein